MAVDDQEVVPLPREDQRGLGIARCQKVILPFGRSLWRLPEAKNPENDGGKDGAKILWILPRDARQNDSFVSARRFRRNKDSHPTLRKSCEGADPPGNSHVSQKRDPSTSSGQALGTQTLPLLRHLLSKSPILPRIDCIPRLCVDSDPKNPLS